MTCNKVTIGLIQSSASENPKDNLKMALDKVRQAAEKGAQIICLQELYRTIYFPQYKKKDFTGYAETVPGESTSAFSAYAKDLKVVIIAPIFEKLGNKFYNSAAVINSDGRLLETYHKTHIPHDPYFYEQNYFEAAGQNYNVYRTEYGNFSVLICYDQWFPEAARICALKGADMIFYPTAIGNMKDYDTQGENWQDSWTTIQRAHAIANGVYVAAVNRVGEEEKLKFFGSSFVSDPFGKVIKKAGCENEEILVAELDLNRAKQIRDAWGFMRNRRPDTYSKLTEI